jgi:hypothetical protein
VRHYSPPRVWYSLHKRKQRLGTTTTVAPPALQPVNTVAPGAPTGTAAVGSVLTIADYGTWTHSPTSYSLKWFASGAEIPSQTGTTYTIALDYAGGTITYQVRANNSGGFGLAMSAASGVVT